jgi:sulfate adenylyltransferase subunit 2
MSSYNLTHLAQLEHEAIFIMREVAAQFERPALLFSGGKDSIVMVRLAQKAFAPAKIPFPLVHVDTGHNFEETVAFRDWLAKDTGSRLVVRYVADSIKAGRCQEEKGPNPSRNGLQTVTLLDTIEEFRYDACLGGARRDEEKARAKERIVSFRDEWGQWDPKNQRPELWSLYNTRVHPGEHLRVFPISNWTELDVWRYIRREELEVVPLYFWAPRPTVLRGDKIIVVDDDRFELTPDDVVTTRNVRFRTLGCYPLSASEESTATSIDDIIAELEASRTSERAGRLIDGRGSASMEAKKKEGYF